MNSFIILKYFSHKCNIILSTIYALKVEGGVFSGFEQQ